MVRPTLLLHFEEDRAAAERLASAAGLPLACVVRHRFPDGETQLRLPAQLPAHVAVLRTLDHPNDKLVELLLCARAARTLGAQTLTLVAPYLAYMRQDIAFHPGEAISQRIVGDFLASLFDGLITVDPHLHRVATLQAAAPVARGVVLSGAPALSDLIAQHNPEALLIGPDDESAQWIAQAAQRHGFDHGVCHKVRHGDHAVDVTLPDIAVRGREVVLLDDVASTGHTLAQATRQLLKAGATRVDVAVTHALFVQDAMALLREAGVSQIWSTDCVPHESNAVSMAAELAHALMQDNG